MSHTFNKAARVFIATCNGDLCAFNAVLPFPHPHKKNTWREHRVVVLPDFQGIGIGSVFTNYVAKLFALEGKSYTCTTSNPAMIHARTKSPLWKTVRIGRVNRGSATGIINNKFVKDSTSARRITVGFEFKG